MIVGLLQPGEMGATVGNALVTAGHDVLWASEGRSDASRARASAFTDAETAADVAARAEVVFSVVPPHAALDTARALAGYAGIYVDANAIAPGTAREVGTHFARFVDGGIIGGPPEPRLYLSGEDAETVAALFAGSPIEARVTSDASALKCAFAGWSKGSGALLLTIRAYAERTGVWDDLAAEWPPKLHARLASAERSAKAKGWRWVGEMEEIAAALETEGMPGGFHEAAAKIYRKTLGQVATMAESKPLESWSLETPRYFQMWAYNASHSQLLLRSTKSEDAPTRVDVFFTGVDVVHLPTSMAALEFIDAQSVDGPNRRYVMGFAGGEGYVVAAGAWYAEDQGDFDDPSAWAFVDDDADRGSGRSSLFDPGRPRAF